MAYHKSNVLESRKKCMHAKNGNAVTMTTSDYTATRTQVEITGELKRRRK